MERLDPRRRGPGRSYVLGAPDVLAAAGSLTLPPAMQRQLEAHTAEGRRVVVFGTATAPLPGDPSAQPPPALAPVALIVLEETLRPDSQETIAYMPIRTSS